MSADSNSSGSKSHENKALEGSRHSGIMSLLFSRGWSLVLNHLGVLVGAALSALSVNIFIIPNHIADGGITGIAIILYYLLGWNVGVVVFVLNLPLYFLAFRYVGKRFLWLSIFGVFVFSVAMQYTANIPMPHITSEPLLACIFGGLLSGIGVGITLKSQGSLGGTDIIGILINRLTSLSVGQVILGVDVLIFLVAAVFFGPEIAMYAMIYMFFTIKVVDFVLTGLDNSKSLMIVANNPEALAEILSRELERGITFLDAEGAYSGQRKKIILCVIGRMQVTQTKRLIHEADPEAFLVIGDASEVIGNGFRRWNK
ncbi:MAG: YitT family protein [Peptococcaceae bacterium]|nr:YitT family protein [Peptococcaceae bacterium]